MTSAKEKFIVALDVSTAKDALEFVNKLRGIAGMFKIGSQLFTAEGPDLVREIVNSGEKVFLDLKFHDIPNTVAGAAVEATRLGVSIFNIHASGGVEMMQRAADATSTVAQAEGIARPIVIAVTVLTSIDESTLVESGIPATPREMVQRLAKLAEDAGMDGVVASPNEITLVRETVQKPGFVIVTPGIRPLGEDIHDQSRISTPREAVLHGADYIVVGRTITQAIDPVAMANEVLKEMETAALSRAS